MGWINSEKLFFEIRKQGYTGGKTILKDYIKPFRETAKKKYTVRYKTLPGEPMQVDWKELGGRDRREKSQVIAVCGHVRLFKDPQPSLRLSVN
jgi:transposase